MAMVKVPNAGENVPGGGYPAPTPHAAVVDQTPYEAPSSMPSTNQAPAPHEGFDAIMGLPEAKQL